MCPPSQTVTSPDGLPVPVTFGAATPSGGLAPVEVSCTRQPGSLFSVGSTSVQCTAIDAATQSSACLFDVTVVVPIPRLTRTKFLAFGDSLTAGEVSVPGSGAGGSNFKFIIIPSESYPSHLATLLKSRYTAQAASIEVQNFGLPGEWAQDGMRRLPGVLANNRPEVVLLFEGYNDIASQLTGGVGAAIDAMDVMAREARNRGARVMIPTLPPPGLDGTHVVASKLVTDYNDRLRILAVGEGAVLVDLYPALLVDRRRYIGIDGLHPTEEGYLRIAQVFRDAVRANLEAR
jgi:lysophospholipase L1-like esterase